MLAGIKTWIKGIVPILLIPLSNIGVFAQEPGLAAEVDLETGLRSNAVRCVAQDKFGRVWVGTDNGVNIANITSTSADAIATNVGSKSIWAINFLDSLVFIGSRFDGLYVFNFITGKLLHHYLPTQINRIRKIKVFDNKIFVLSNDGVFQWHLNKLSEVKLTESINDDFPTDAFLWNGNTYVLVYPTHQVMRLSGGAFETNSTKEFIPASVKTSLLCAYAKDNKLIIGGDGFYVVKNANAKPLAFLLPGSQDEQLVVVDVAITQSKIILAISENSASQKGMIYVHGDKLPDLPADDFESGFITSVIWDSLDDKIFYGDLTNGLFLQKFISTRSQIPGRNKSRLIESKNYRFLLSKGKLIDQTFDNTARKLTYASRPTIEKVTYAKIFGDTLIATHHEEFRLYDAQSLRQRGSIKFPDYTSRGVVSIEKLEGNFYLFYNYVHGVYKVDMNRGVVDLITSVESFLPKTKNVGKRIVLFNSEKGFSVIESTKAYNLSSTDNSIAFAEDFEVLHDNLYVLLKGRLKSFTINFLTHALIAQHEILLDKFVQGFEPKWILSKDDRLYLVNEKGVVQLNVKDKVPVNYFYFGNYTEVNKPSIVNDYLVLRAGSSIIRFPFASIDRKKVRKTQQPFALKYPASVNENLPFEIEIEYLENAGLQRGLRTLDVSSNGKEPQRFYSINNKFNFPQGLPFGDYTLAVHTGGKGVSESINITLPLNRNPYFFASIIFFSLVIFFLLIRSHFKKRQYQKHIIQNRLQILKQNLNPHFVFNSMNLISALILEKKYTKAVQVVSEFSNLQRTYLETNNKESISLHEELQFLESYLKLQQTRFHNDKNFKYELTIAPEINTEAIYLPPLILQPLAENAIKYGIISSMSEPKKIWIDVSGSNPIRIGIEDNGEQEGSINKGFGLGHQLVQERIKLFKSKSGNPIRLLTNLPLLHSAVGYRVEVHV